MYCPSCGTEVTRELNYCNRCGANLNPTVNAVEQQPVRVVSVNGPFWAMALMVVIGIGITFASINDLAKKDVPPAALTWMVIGSLGTILAVVALFLRHLSNMSGVQQKQFNSPAQRQKSERDSTRPAQLPPQRTEPVPSVTENTTRTFEPIKRGR